MIAIERQLLCAEAVYSSILQVSAHLEDGVERFSRLDAPAKLVLRNSHEVFKVSNVAILVLEHGCHQLHAPLDLVVVLRVHKGPRISVMLGVFTSCAALHTPVRYLKRDALNASASEVLHCRISSSMARIKSASAIGSCNWLVIGNVFGL